MLRIAYERLARPRIPIGSVSREPIVQFNTIDVHLTHSSSQDTFAQAPRFWVEAYSHASASIIECYGFHKLDEDELARIIEFITLVQRLFVRC
jgi:hypothetical protein